jgi:predicted dehydrogenase
MKNRSDRTNRRRFLKTTAAAGVGFWAAGGIAPRASRAAIDRIGFAAIGIGGKGSSDSADAARHGDMIAICDVDTDRLNGAGDSRFPKAKRFTDFRKMLEEKNIDAVTVSTPDHTHAPASLMAMRLGMHCFCQKPLTRTIYEARLMGTVATEKKLATEMGNQGTALPGARKAAALIRAGVLGNVKEVHVWTNRPIWPQGGERPTEAPVPGNLNWDAWISASPMRPYGDGYHPFKWRGWWDFGTGALGDMACHTVNMPFMALDLLNPTSVVAQTSGHNQDSYPKWSIIDFEFPANANRPALKFRWYDGGKLPPLDLLKGRTLGGDKLGSGALIIGDKAKLFTPADYGERYEIIGDVELPEVQFTKSPGHFEEWVRAIRGGPQAMSNFTTYAGPLTETILLGNLAVWSSGKKIEWDAKNLNAKHASEVADIIKPEYRKGYTLDA